MHSNDIHRRPRVTTRATSGVSAAASSPPASTPKGASDWQEELLAGSVGTEEAVASLVKLVLRGRVGEGMPYRQATLRPVVLRGKRRLQLSLLDARQVRLPSRAAY